MVQGGDDAEMRTRLDKLSRELEAKRQAEVRETAPGGLKLGGSIGRAMSLGFRVMAEFVAGIVVGCLIGWQLDRWFSTSPAFFIVFAALGTIAGFWNVYRIAAAPTGRGDGKDAKNAGASAPPDEV